MTAAHVITANDLKDGLVVYQAGDNGWVESVQAAEVLDETALDAALARAKTAEGNDIVVGVYAIEVEANDDGIRPTRYRERLRAFGPSTHPEFSRTPDQSGSGPAESR